MNPHTTHIVVYQYEKILLIVQELLTEPSPVTLTSSHGCHFSIFSKVRKRCFSVVLPRLVVLFMVYVPTRFEFLNSDGRVK